MKLCFWLFGYRIEAVTYGYLSILIGSILIYVLAFYREPALIFLAASFLAGFYLLLPSIVYNPQLTTVLGLRWATSYHLVAGSRARRRRRRHRPVRPDPGDRHRS